MIKWFMNLFSESQEDILKVEIEELIGKAENVFDLNIIWAKMIIYAKMNTDIKVCSKMRDNALLRELIIQKQQAIALEGKINV
jgi:hypothetical protein